MAILSDERRAFPFENVSPGYGNFAVGYRNENNSWNGWQTCREVMQLQFKLENPGLWFSYEAKELEGILEFMTWVERTLQIHDRTRFYLTEPVKYYAWVEPAWFWRSSEMRKNLFTMFLRNGRFYGAQTGPKSITQALLAYTYSKGTMLALERFFAGFTKYVGPDLVASFPNLSYIKMGWYSQFVNGTAPYIRDNLKAPDWVPPVVA
jgi:hypothetical protein